MRAGVVWAIARKDLAEVFAGREVWGPALVSPAIQVVALPLYAHLLGGVRDTKAFEDLPPQLVVEVVRHLPPDLAATVHALPPGPMLAVILTGHLAAPAFLLAPMLVATWIGAAAFVGEKERRTLEALLYTPATDGELLCGKLLASVAPALGLCWLTFALYALAENWATWEFMHRWWFPTAIWWPWQAWVCPAALVLAATGTVAISARARTQVGANQLGGLFGAAVSLLVIGQAVGLLSTDIRVAWVVGAGLWLLDLGLLAWAIHDFSRERLIRRI